MSNESINDYVPFGPEWEKEVMKLSKANLVQMYRSANIHSQSIEKERDELKLQLAEHEHRLEGVDKRNYELVEYSERLVEESDELKKILSYVKRNAEKIGAHTWQTYKEQILEHCEILDESNPETTNTKAS